MTFLGFQPLLQHFDTPWNYLINSTVLALLFLVIYFIYEQLFVAYQGKEQNVLDVLQNIL